MPPAPLVRLDAQPCETHPAPRSLQSSGLPGRGSRLPSGSTRPSPHPSDRGLPYPRTGPFRLPAPTTTLPSLSPPHHFSARRPPHLPGAALQTAPGRKRRSGTFAVMVGCFEKLRSLSQNWGVFPFGQHLALINQMVLHYIRQSALHCVDRYLTWIPAPVNI